MTTVNLSHMRASDRDRDRATSLLQDAYADGRLTKEEYDARLGWVLSAQVFAQLDQVTADLVAPAPYRPPPMPPGRTNSMAVASLVCGLAQPLTGGLTTITAIVLGHVARHQIRRNGEAGAGMALWGLILGWAAVALAVIMIIAIAGLIAHAGHPAPAHPLIPRAQVSAPG